MKIIFLCGSLEPGKDGVGDYTRRLAGELVRKGNQVALISLSEKSIEKPVFVNQEDDQTCLEVFRIPEKLEMSVKMILALEKIKAFGPDWISLQFVPFSFHPKGLIYQFTKEFLKLRQGYKLHIMFHELWVGAYGIATAKQKILGFIQKLLIKSFLKRVKPEVINTSIQVYKKAISNFNPSILPLFGAIPILPENLKSQAATEELVAVHFGTFTGSLQEFHNQIDFLNRIGTNSNKKVKLLVFGGGGEFKNAAMETARQVLGSEALVDLGRLSVEEVSRQMLLADIGISRADYPFVGKSSTTQTMLEHGLPVLLRGSASDLTQKDKAEQIFKMNFLFADSSDKILPAKEKPVSYLSKVGSMFLELTQTKSNSSI